MPETIFLKQAGSLASQVAEALLRDGQDLSKVEVWIPTAGAGRRIRRSMAEKGVLSPRFTQPMRAILPENRRIAERFEREGAWARVLKKMDRETLHPLFSGGKLENEAARQKSGGVLCDLCDLLAEGGWRPTDDRVSEVCSDDAERWGVLEEIYQRYILILKNLGLIDPNEARFLEMANPLRAVGLSRLVVACIPDLPMASQRYAEALEKLGVKVEVLVWFSGEVAGGFDRWGRPIPGEWADCRINVDASQIALTRSPEDEARQALDFALSAKTTGDYALLLADSKMGDFFCSEVKNRGGNAFLPDGGRLDLSESGVIAIEWERFRAKGDLRGLRRLLELPRFSRVLRGGSDLKTDDALAVCDFLIGETVLSDFSEAEAFSRVAFDSAKDKSQRRAQAQIFVGLVKSLLPETASSLLAKAWMSGGEGLEVARKVERIYRSIVMSPLYRDDDAGIESAFARTLKSEPIFDSSQAGDVELSGWLEAPWIESERLAVCGCVEGAIPSSVNGHAFLPDSKRSALGLADNAARFARDAYLFNCLLLARPVGEFRCYFSRFDAEGSPSLPSRLFLRCGNEALPERVLSLFAEVRAGVSRATRGNHWLWDLPESMRRKVEKMSPTDFSEYLACPFRYYLKKVLWLDAFTPDAREMDSKRFGILVHEAVEKFGRETPNESAPATIERLVLDHFDGSVNVAFGPSPSPAVRIQIEGAKTRLRAFARIQAEQIAAGWRIVSTERKLEAHGENPLCIGSLHLSGKIDRIEKNTLTGAWRVLDYKTSADGPAKKHFGPRHSKEWLPDAELEIGDSEKPKKKRWANLQLPLYRKILDHWHGDEIGDNPISTGYFLLTADPAETAVLEFEELNDDVMESAMTCARTIAGLVHKGVFWPPQPLKSSWEDPFEALFLNGAPDACIAPATIQFLKGEK